MSDVTILRDFVKANAGDPDVDSFRYKLAGVGVFIARPNMVGVKSPDGAVWAFHARLVGYDWIVNSPKVAIVAVGDEYTVRGEPRTMPDWKTPSGVPA